MRVIATLLVRNEEEIVRECIEHHLAHGVDGIIVTDNGSKDNTRKIVEDCRGVLEIIDEPVHNHHQARWVTRMARHAHRFGAYWVVHLDCDEFWFGLEVLHDTAMFKGVGVIEVRRELIHVPIQGLEFGKFRRDQMPYYIRNPRPLAKVIHRAVEKPHIGHGNHTVTGIPGRRIGTPKEIRIHHYPIRSYGHFKQKVVQGGTALQRHPGPISHGIRWRKWFQLYKQGKLGAVYAKNVWTPEEIEAGLAEGRLRIHIPPEYKCDAPTGPTAPLQNLTPNPAFRATHTTNNSTMEEVTSCQPNQE